MVILFDLVGTLFKLDAVRDVFRGAAIPDDVLPFWFARLLHVSMASTLSGRYAPFLAAAESALGQALAVRDLPRDVIPATLRALQRLEPYDDTRPMLGALAAAGHTLAAVSNAPAGMQQALIDGADLRRFFAATLSSDDVRRAKPDPTPYRAALQHLGATPERAWMVAAHAWDIQGAAAVGLRTIWVSRVEKAWGFPGPPPGATAASLAEVPALVAAG